MPANHGNDPNRHIHNTDNEDTILIPNDIGNFAPPPQDNEMNAQQPYYGNQPNPFQQNGYEQPYQQPYYGNDPYANQQNPFAAGYDQQAQQQQYGYQQQPYNGYPQYQQYPQQNNVPQQQYYDGQQYYSPYQQPAPPQRKQPGSKKYKKKKKHKSLVGKIIRRVLLSLLSLGIVLFGVYSCMSVSMIKQINYVPTGDRTRTEGALDAGYVTSILVIGTDGLTSDDRGRSDSMVLISINKKTNEITSTSFMRDCYVDIPGYSKNKLNAAYSFGGPELLMDTIEKNFNVRIDNYISINFNAFSSVIDSVDGIEVEMSDDEAKAVDTILISQLNELMGDAQESDLLYAGGKHILNGKQALAYSRIRNVGNNDFERTERQRRVISKVLEKAKKKGLSFIRKAADKAFPNLTSNMTTKELYLLSLRLPFILRYDRQQLQIPAEGTYSGEDIYLDDGSYMSVLQVDFEENYNIIKDEVFSED